MHRYLFAIAFASLGLAGVQRAALAQQGSQSADSAAAVQAAQPAAEAWLALFTEGKAQESWEKASRLFQENVPVNTWTQQAAAIRSQLGVLQSRRLERAEYATDVPDAPPGEYVVLTYTSSFANLPAAREQVTTILEDGAWKVIGYFIQPAADS